MPSTVVHVALAGLVGTALLGDEFDARAIAVVMAATACIDLDVFLGWYFIGTHRAAFHTLLLPLTAAAVVYYDTRMSEQSRIRTRWGPYGSRVAWSTIAAVTLAGIGPDLTFNGVNLLYPLHDQFYAFDGELYYSTDAGIVQTFVDLEESARGTTQETQFYTGVDPEPGSTGADAGGDGGSPERIFPVVANGDQLIVVVAGVVTVAARLFERRA
ncbi:metal-dependent hydrolase [Halostella sp. PRR32]|uniref:metal-dependent hydrolase n=1 Tax=Halostella sp. PRR32 TaxID=3098147 RepID=UPI002B1D887B|nr:metal-dependent hydrolase [Halostella sp. PRR32]